MPNKRNVMLCKMVKRLICIIVLVPLLIDAQTIRKMYLDSNLKSVFDEEFASYVLSFSQCQDPDYRRFRILYWTNELYADGFYNHIDTIDFNNSDLSNSTFFNKDGSKFRIIKQIDERRKVITSYHKNGLISSIDSLYDGNLDGCRIELDENNRQCKYYCYSKGQLALPYYVCRDVESNFESLFDVRTSTPYFVKAPQNGYKIVDVDELGSWECYEINNMLLAIQPQISKDHGHYFQIWVSVSNNSLLPIEFNPSSIFARVFIAKKQRFNELTQLSKSEYKNKLQKKGFWEYFAIGLTGLAVGFANSLDYQLAQNSGYSFSESTITSYISSNPYLRVRSTGFDVTSAIVGQQIINDRISRRNIAFGNMVNNVDNTKKIEANLKTINYLERTIIKPGENLLGYLNFKYEKSDELEIVIPINGIQYSFNYNTNPKQNLSSAKFFDKGKYKLFDVITKSGSQTIEVRGLKEGDIIEICDKRGNIIRKIDAMGNHMKISLKDGIYVIKVGGDYKRILVDSTLDSH